MSGTIQPLFFSSFQICFSLHRSISASACPADRLFVDIVALFVCMHMVSCNRIYDLSCSGRLSRWKLFHWCILWLVKIMVWSGHLNVTKYFFQPILLILTFFCHWNSLVFVCVAVLILSVATKIQSFFVLTAKTLFIYTHLQKNNTFNTCLLSSFQIHHSLRKLPFISLKARSIYFIQYIYLYRHFPK